MKKLLLVLALAASFCAVQNAFAQTSFPIKVGAEPTVTVSLSADAVTSVTAGIANIIAGPPPTTLAVAATSGDTTLTLTSFAGVASGMGLKIENEICGVAVTPSTGVVTVVRAQIGSTAAAHPINTPVTILRNGLYGEFIANLVADAIRVFMIQYPATAIASANATIATQQANIATAVAAGVGHTP